MKPPIKNIFALEPLQEQKATLCQTVSQSVLKWMRKMCTNKQTNKHFRIYNSRDRNLITFDIVISQKYRIRIFNQSLLPSARQLPLMAAVLSGQSEFSLLTMRQNQQLQLFNYILGLLELLQPSVFDPQHDGFLQVLEAFFDLMKVCY